MIHVYLQEQIIWSVEEGADYIIAETFMDYGEAVLALECIQEYGNGKVTGQHRQHIS